VVFESTDVTFDVLWRDAGNVDPQPSGFNAVLYEDNALGPEVAAKANDQLVLRMSAPPGGYPDGTMLWLPNGDQEKTMGRDPNLTLPK
jgi:hypothetical protein